MEEGLAAGIAKVRKGENAKEGWYLFGREGIYNCRMIKPRVMRTAAVMALLLIGGVAGTAVRGCALVFPQVTMSSLSPNDQWRVILAERRLDIDRNFVIQLEEVKSGRVRTVFNSPDEGRPVGSERIIWSVDSRRFLVLGRHFYGSNAARFSTGEQPYLLMDLPTGKAWCNAGQQEGLPEFGREGLDETKWFGWTPD